MAGSLTQFGEKLLLNYSIGIVDADATNIPSTGLYLGLCYDTTIAETGSADVAFSEFTYPAVTGRSTGYRRQLLTPSRWIMDTTGSTTTLTYGQEVVFPVYSRDDTLTARYLLLYTQLTGGKPVWYVPIDNGTGRTLTNGDTLKLAASSLVVTLT